jgi:DNA-binding MarR family transcriptional regulator
VLGEGFAEARKRRPGRRSMADISVTEVSWAAMTTVQGDLRTRDLSAGLLAVIGPLRRALRRAGREGVPGFPLPTSQAELLRVVRLQPGIGVGEAAQQLGLAGNTVSTLVNQLVAAGFLARRRDPADGRVARLELTAGADRRMALWRDQREQALGAALDELSARERETLERALPALHKILEVLERAT